MEHARSLLIPFEIVIVILPQFWCYYNFISHWKPMTHIYFLLFLSPLLYCQSIFILTTGTVLWNFSINVQRDNHHTIIPFIKIFSLSFDIYLNQCYSADDSQTKIYHKHIELMREIFIYSTVCVALTFAPSLSIRTHEIHRFWINMLDL